MSFTVTIVASLIRACLITLLAMSLAHRLQPCLKTNHRWQQRLIWGALLAPFFCPDLLVGYAYYNFSLSLIHHPGWNEFFYGFLVVLKTVPVATVLLHFSPPAPLSAEGLYCRDLISGEAASVSKSRQWESLRHWLWWFRGPGLRLLPAGGLTFLVAFQEFEICSLMNTTAWTLWLFDARAIGWESENIFRFGSFPLAIELCVLMAAVGTYLYISKFANRAMCLVPTQPSSLWRGTTWAYLMLAFVLIVAIPIGLVFRGTLSGWTVFLTNQSLLRETGYACAFAVAAGLLAHGTAVYWAGRGQLGGWSKVGLFLICLPGLCGSFLMSLALFELFQQEPFHHLYDTPFPLVLGLYLFVLPRAVLIQFIRRDVVQREPLFLGKLLRSSPSATQQRSGLQLRWEQQWWPQFWCLLPVFFWAYFEMTTPSILASPATTPAPLRLYNFMHYGQGTGLSAMLSAIITAPCLLILLVMLVFKFVQAMIIRWSVANHSATSDIPHEI
ncbi:hypothetical protein Pla110_04960 [Polystyrenella longa]|uniref:ABC transmembrane type-1 domain-containing protein n=1 Tax=Polystyrenella longa TaxID=2528007 RepID=A0A518CHU2_9PLAN|nr:hypothetical protein [Polystyrenella longa]QDU78792.1 hypothetical protein Pla110_04960 [Polystyrenella longa]